VVDEIANGWTPMGDPPGLGKAAVNVKRTSTPVKTG